MPSGRTHDRITLWSLPLVAGVTYERTRDATMTLMVSGAFLFGGLMFGPDLDIYSRQYQRWGLLRWIWLPYRRALRHRSFWSHGPVVGTLGRIFYLVAWLLSAVALSILISAIACAIMGSLDEWQLVTQQSLGSSSQWLSQAIQNQWLEIIAILVGLELGSISHSMSDWIGSSYRRLTKRPRSHKHRPSPSTPPAQSVELPSFPMIEPPNTDDSAADLDHPSA